jgi:hypothetical protein
MSITRIDNIFSQKEIDHMLKIISEGDSHIDARYGRLRVSDLEHGLLPETIEKFNNIVKNISTLPLKMGSVMSVDYSPLYGEPHLPPHFDGDSNDLIINIQLDSNTFWDIGLNLETYRLNDNCALIFNANEEVHWRVHKRFKEGEHVLMVFARFFNEENLSDYSHLSVPDDKILKAPTDFRNSLGIFD